MQYLLIIKMIQRYKYRLRFYIFAVKYRLAPLLWISAHCISQQELLTLTTQLRTSQPSIFAWWKY